MKTNIEFIKDIIKLYEDNEWTQFYNARDMFNNGCRSNSSLACKFCLNGAIHKVTKTMDEYERVHSIIQQHIPIDDYFITAWNDSPKRTKEDVIKLLNDIIPKENKDNAQL